MKKRQIKSLMIVGTIILTLVSCGKTPTADFTWEPKNPIAGQEMKFTNLSINAKSYDWNFGDMSVGTEKDPTHTYQTKGDHIIDLLVHNGGKSDQKTVTITVNQ